MRQHLAHVALLVRDYDEALAYYVGRLGFRLLEDTPLGAGKRWVLVAPPGARETALLLARAATAEQVEAVGRQGGGRVFLFLHTDDFRRDHALLRERGVAFIEAPREEPYGTVAVFTDLYGNRWDLVQPHAGGGARAARDITADTMTDATPRCVRCDRPIEVNRDLAADHFAGMHWLCFHLEVEHPGDPDAPCAAPACHVARAQLYAQALRDAGIDPHAVMRQAIARRRP